MKKIITMYTAVNKQMLEKEFEVTNSLKNLIPIAEKYDFLVCANTLPPKTDFKKCVLIITEPPHTHHRRMLYGLIKNNFHTVFTFNPNPDIKHQFGFGDNPLVYPYNPATNRDIIRPDTTIRKRHIYWAGHKPPHGSLLVPDTFGAINLMGIRSSIAVYLMKNYPETTIMGKNWGRDTKNVNKEKGWRLQKQIDLDNCQADFHLCMENSMLKNYTSEKIHDGFATDRVVLYLGNPEIEKFVPKEAFVNLNPLLNKQTKEFDYKKLIKIISTMTQKEYDDKLKAAREWRMTIKGEWVKEQAKFTQLVIDRINGEI